MKYIISSTIYFELNMYLIKLIFAHFYKVIVHMFALKHIHFTKISPDSSITKATKSS